DAVVIATPNHWHGLQTIWACQAGKHVYVEKPVTHNLWEGARMLEAEQQYGVLIQAGTQNRSNPGLADALEYLKTRPLGAIQWIHGLFWKFRGSIGYVTSPQTPPPGADYNLFCGPAPLTPLMRKTFHYDWHWQWATGNGDMGNLGAHTTDDVRRVLGDSVYPKRIMSCGGRFVHRDNGETPNAHLAVFDYAGIPVFIEMRSLPTGVGTERMDHVRGIRNGTIVQCEGGWVNVGRGGGVFYDSSGKKVKSFAGDAGAGHVDNLITALRANDRSLLNAPLKAGVAAGELFHLANVSYRAGDSARGHDGRVLREQRLGAFPQSEAPFDHMMAMLKRNEVDLETSSVCFGPWLSYSPTPSEVRSESEPHQAMVESLLTPTYREPFTIPSKL
ncbi:MAG: Gfo/Idh/MocA family oxidoreductase, partial [Pirellulales bacterium]|nr:Gfo/Idh/MocA family oxidoreductase [Pirellulales bacterium]